MGGKTVEPFYYTHFWKNVCLLVLSVVTIPISAVLVAVGLIASSVTKSSRDDTRLQRKDDATQKTILVTGVSMTKGLAIARNLAQNTSHRIIGADLSSLSPGRFSSSIAKYYRLDAPHGDDAEPYIDSILSIIRAEKVDLWISCSSVLAAVEDGQVVRLAQAQAKEQGRTFAAIQFNEDEVEKFHEKDKFIAYIDSLGLTIPESHRCTSPDEALDILLQQFDTNRKHTGLASERKFIMKPIAVDDRARAAMMTLLPFSTAEETKSYIRALHISPSNPFQLQQFIRGKEYCTHALVIRGAIRAFTACPSLELLMHYEALEPESALSKAMLEFTRKVVANSGEEFTGHLSFDFLVEEGGEKEDVVYPIECNPRAHTAVALFGQTAGMADAYLSIFSEKGDHGKGLPVFPDTPTDSYYWVGHDMVTYGMLPSLDVLFGKGGLQDAGNGFATLMNHLVYWKDGTFTLEDPWPFFVLYHLYWPARFIESLRANKRWSRMNVSTTKMFED